MSPTNSNTPNKFYTDLYATNIITIGDAPESAEDIAWMRQEIKRLRKEVEELIQSKQTKIDSMGTPISMGDMV